MYISILHRQYGGRDRSGRNQQRDSDRMRLKNGDGHLHGSVAAVPKMTEPSDARDTAHTTLFAHSA